MTAAAPAETLGSARRIKASADDDRAPVKVAGSKASAAEAHSKAQMRAADGHIDRAGDAKSKVKNLRAQAGEALAKAKRPKETVYKAVAVSAEAQASAREALAKVGQVQRKADSLKVQSAAQISRAKTAAWKGQERCESSVAADWDGLDAARLLVVG